MNCVRGETRKAARVLETLEEKDSGAAAKVDVIMYNMLINGYCRTGDVDKGLELLERMMVTYNKLLKALCASGKLDRALERQIESKCYSDVFTFNILLEAVIEEGGVGKGKEFLDEMKTRGCNPDIVMYSILVKGLCQEGRDGKVEASIEILNQLSHKGCTPTLFTYSIVIDGLSKTGKMERGLELLAEMKEKGFKPGTVTYTTLVGGLAREGKVDQAVDLFGDLEEFGVMPDVITYNYVMSALCNTGQTDRAIDFLHEMVCKGLKPNKSSYKILIKGVESEGLIKEAIELRKKLGSCRMNKINTHFNPFQRILPAAVTWGIDVIPDLYISGFLSLILDRRERRKGFDPISSRMKKWITPNSCTMSVLHYGEDAAAEVQKPEFAINDTPVCVLLPPGNLHRRDVICIAQSDQIQVTTFSRKEPTVGLTTLRRLFERIKMPISSISNARPALPKLLYSQLVQVQFSSNG
ncbi:Pentatricopeptide repeat-containing protein [Drosera capensis]